jgi:hypothetical protein
MMRPIIGKPIPLGISSKKAQPGKLAIYPNPCSSGNVRVDFSEQPEDPINTGLWRLTVRNLYGQTVWSVPFTQNLDVSGLSGGFYVIEMLNSFTGQRFTGKLLVIR